MKVVFLDSGTFPQEIELRPIIGITEFKSYVNTEQDNVIRRTCEADVVITNKVRITRQDLDHCPNLKLIAVAATGTDNIDLDACRERGIKVSNIKNYARETVPEHTFALMLALRRSLIPYHESVKKGRWQQAGQFCYFDYPIKNLHGSTLGIIGDGVLGKSVAEIAKAFGMNVIFSAYKDTTGMGPLYTPFEDVLRQSDIISIHCPYNTATHHMFSGEEFRLMKKTALLINTARGGIVDEEALLHALNNKDIAGAAFDVTSKEPPKADSPIMNLLNLPNFILTPHISWASIESIQLLADIMIDNINSFYSGEQKNIVI